MVSRVPDVEIPRLAIEGEAPGVAQALGPDEVKDAALRIAGRGKGIAGRNRVVRALVHVAVDVEPEQLTEVAVVPLRKAAGISRTAPIAEARVKVAIVGSELELAAVVVIRGAGETEQVLDAGRIGAVRVRDGYAVA